MEQQREGKGSRRRGGIRSFRAVGIVDPGEDFGFHSKCFGKTLEGFMLGSDMSIFTYEKLTLAACGKGLGGQSQCRASGSASFPRKVLDVRDNA